LATRLLEQAPSLPRLYARALATARGRRGDRLPAAAFQLEGVEVDRAALAAYDQVCGFGLRDELPATYPHVLAFPLAMALMVEPEFPFPLAGLVHVANRITQSRPLRVGEPLTLRVHAEELRPHPRGRQFDLVGEASVAGERVWRDVSTYLRLERARGRGTGEEIPAVAGRPSAIWRVAGDAGRRYASVSGDSNPIHLNPWLARLFGFPRAIAHGMWLQARCLSALEGRLPDALEVAVEFRSPVLLPSRVALVAEPEDGGWRFAVRDPAGDRVHLTGRAGPAAGA
jgi:acyl dehydratase